MDLTVRSSPSVSRKIKVINWNRADRFESFRPEWTDG